MKVASVTSAYGQALHDQCMDCLSADGYIVHVYMDHPTGSSCWQSRFASMLPTCRSQEYLNQKRIEKSMAKTGQYNSAEQVREAADELYALELSQTQQAFDAGQKFKLAKFAAKQKQELEALLQRGARGRDEFQLRRVTETERRLYRFRNVITVSDGGGVSAAVASSILTITFQEEIMTRVLSTCPLQITQSDAGDSLHMQRVQPTSILPGVLWARRAFMTDRCFCRVVVAGMNIKVRYSAVTVQECVLPNSMRFAGA